MAHNKCVKKACKNCDCIKDDLTEIETIKEVLSMLVMHTCPPGAAKELMQRLGTLK